MPTSVSTSITGLQTAMDNAVPGTVITQTGGPGAPTALAINTNVTGDGVAVVLDPQQITMISRTSGAVGGFHFYGGYFAADLVNGLTTSGSNYSAWLDTGCARVSFRGNRFGPGAYGIVGGAVTDVSIANVRIDGSRGDAFNFTDFTRLQVDGCAGGDFTGGTQFCYFPDGRAPQEGISQTSCQSQGGTWVDSTHLDFVQAYASGTGTGTQDLTLTNNTLVTVTQGLDNFNGSAPANGMVLRRAKIWNNSIQTSQIAGIVFTGDQFDIRNNTLAGHPYYMNTDVHLQIIADGNAPATSIYGGGNVAPHILLGTLATPVDLASSAMNGATVAAAALPVQSVTIPAYFPATPSTPPSLLGSSAPFSSAGGPVAFPAGPLGVGAWASLSRAKWGNAIGATFSYRWRLSGNLVGTGQTYQVQPGDIGLLIGEVMAVGTNSLSSAWVPTTAGIMVNGGAVLPSRGAARRFARGWL